MDAGLYGPDSITWKLTRESAMLLGGPRALLMQLAHPLVAAGVAQHSAFRDDPLTRLRRTLDATLSLVFGCQRDAQAAAGQINRVHAQVRGRLPEASGRFPAGTPYDARDPELLMWVHATLVDTTLTVYPRYVEPLTEGQMAQFYEESKLTARMLGVPDEILPADLSAFRSYMDEMLASDDLGVAPFQAELGRAVLYPKVAGIPRPFFELGTAITIGLLPERLRRLYGLRFTPRRRRLYGWSPGIVRGIRPVLPRVARHMPQARAAYRRVGA
jgi:uncharacterized protein (DUF2236 family)